MHQQQYAVYHLQIQWENHSPQNDALMRVVTMARCNYYYASGLIVGQLLGILRFHQIFTLLGSKLLKSWNNKHLHKEAVQDFVKTVAAANPLARIFISSIIPHLGAKQQTLYRLKEFNWATRKKITKLCKRGFTVEYINLHKLFLNDNGLFKAIAHWYTPDNYHVSNYGVYVFASNFWRPVASFPNFSEGLNGLFHVSGYITYL